MKIGDGVFYVLNEGPNKGQIRPALVTRVYKSSEDYLTGEKFENGQPKWGVRACELVDLTIFPSMRDGFSRPTEWRADVKVDKTDEKGDRVLGTCFSMSDDKKPANPTSQVVTTPKAEGSKAETASDKSDDAKKADGKKTTPKAEGSKAETASK